MKPRGGGTTSSADGVSIPGSEVQAFGRHFAEHGSEKMIFDVRQGPHAVCHGDVVFVVYQANPTGHETHPHIAAYDKKTGEWTGPFQIGANSTRYDHHYAPIIWIDDNEHIHVLYGCHVTPGVHVISRRPNAIDEWEPGAEIAGSISYPTVLPIAEGRLLLFYRALGHLGFWAFRLSEDGGHTWSEAQRLIDLDQDPREDDDGDTWAGSYPGICRSPDGRSLHIGFVYWDERLDLPIGSRKRPHPKYKIRKRSRARYHLYYVRLEIDTGNLFTANGDPVEKPVNRRGADEHCKLWDTGYELTNSPSVAVDSGGAPCFLLPVSHDSAWHSNIYFVSRKENRWSRTILTTTNNTWAGCLLQPGGNGDFIAYVVAGSDHDETLYYSGGIVERWRSEDEGATWRLERRLIPEPDLYFNNPRAIELMSGDAVDGQIIFFGWSGPGSIEADTSADRNRARAFLWDDGRWL